MKKELLSKLYEKNPDTGNFIIEIALDKYVDVFNEWDHASYRKRDMDPELAYFLEDCLAEIPSRHDVDLFFYLPKQLRDMEKEKIISAVVKNYYTFYSNLERKGLRAAYHRTLTHIMVSLGLLSSTYLLNLGRNNVVLSTLQQGLTVGGWVFLWEAISFFFFKRSETTDKITRYERLANAGIYFRYDP